jgi:multicomponent Na+:H+ antiporter subunit E
MRLALRAAPFLGLWLVLAGPHGLPFGLLAALAAGAASLHLLPPAGRRVSLPAMGLLVWRTLSQTLLAGIDIARRAFDPRLPLAPDIVAVPLAMPPGAARDGLTALGSLAPGALPMGEDATGALLVHALDTRLPVQAGLQATADLYARALGLPAAHG